MSKSPRDQHPSSYRELFSLREYRSLFAADVVSQFGDQVAAVALAILVYDRSHSPFLAALGYSLVFLPWIVGGPVLAALAERLPSRRVLVGTDFARAALIAVAAVPGVPLVALGALLLTAALLSPPFRAARSAVMVDLLEGDRYSLSLSVTEVVHQSAQLLGFLGGGALVLLLHPQGALALNAASFAASGALLLRGLQPRPAGLTQSQRSSVLREAAAGIQIVAHDPALRRPLLLAVVGATYVVVPEAIAPAFVAQQHAGSVAVGLVMASVAAGSAAGAVLIARLVDPARRLRLMLPLAAAGTLPLILLALTPGVTLSLALLVVAGVCTAYNVPANAAFAAAVPPNARARAFGFAMTALMGGQLLGVVLGGALAEVFPPSDVIAGVGAAALVALVAMQISGGGRSQDRVICLPEQPVVIHTPLPAIAPHAGAATVR